MSPPKAPSNNKAALRILMLHGYTQSGPLFRSKTRALHKALTKSLHSYEIHLSYPTGPIRLDPADIPGYNAPSGNNDEEEPEPAFGWWRRKDLPHPMQQSQTEIIYTGLQDGLTRIGETIKTEGPFDGVIGFSQGACAAGMVASLLEPGRRGVFAKAACEGKALKEKFPVAFHELLALQPPLKFAIIYSGFPAPNELRYGNFYDPKLKTPTLHFLGSVDGVVDEGRSRALVERCENARVVVHPGGHFLPSQRPWLDAAVGYVRECMEAAGDGVGGNWERKRNEEEGVEDMDVPF
ncbi:MAG: hypothetical protein LQ343_001891 [Gyalolechia ehrenbergii]|nr:MAG: hypothetical protein LQ343_001891 [Gyalolechia ehrenbergii]